MTDKPTNETRPHESGIIEVDVPEDAADIECPLCEGEGERDGQMCPNCGGDGWV